MTEEVEPAARVQVSWVFDVLSPFAYLALPRLRELPSGVELKVVFCRRHSARDGTSPTRGSSRSLPRSSGSPIRKERSLSRR